MLVYLAFLTLTLLDYGGESVVDLFISFEYQRAEGRFEGRLFKYQLFVPESKPDGARLPLIVWMHGEGESGDDNVQHLRWLRLLLKDKSDPRKFPFFLLAVQKPADEPWFDSTLEGSSSPDDMVGVVMSIVGLLMRDFPIDPDRVCVSGVSSGGTASWELGIRYPERLAAIAPLASRGPDPERVRRLVGVPVRAFHSTYDVGTPLEPVRISVEAINDVGGTASLVEIESNRHDCWTAAFEKHELLKWLLSQNRGSPPRDFLNQALLRACQEFLARYALVSLIPVLLAAAWRLEKRRRLNMTK